ncbi:MAG: P83/100 family protein, partial [Treponema sp.]|nr:P83/100 family protein [Treponema sp.]
MKKIFASILIFFAFALTDAFAIDVNENELKSTGDEGTIVFENYSGPHAVIETIEAIKAIGSGLGNRLRQQGLDQSATIGANEKYTVIHAVDETTGKLDADIFIINSNATVDHIRNLRRIIGAYLSAAYGYTENDAATVATFVTVYNAVYRNNMEAFNSKYKDIVTKNLTESKCGLSTKWTDWPGNSQIVIPLGEFADGGLSSVETSVISDKNVVNSMKEEDDKGIDERKNMVDIKEREADEASEKAQT